MSKDNNKMNDSNNHLTNNIDKLALDLPAVIDGEIIPIEEVDDQIFSSKLVGDGYAIHPTGQTIISPVDAKIEQIALTNHAVYLSMSNGMKLLIHIGIDTIELEGKGFKSLLEKGMSVKRGDALVEIDKQFIIDEGYSPVISVVVLDQPTDHFKVTVYPTKEAISNETIALKISIEK